MQAYTIHPLFIGPVINCSPSPSRHRVMDLSTAKIANYRFCFVKIANFSSLAPSALVICLSSSLAGNCAEKSPFVSGRVWCTLYFDACAKNGANFIFSYKRIRWQRCSRGSAPRPRLVEIDELTVEMWTPDPCDLWGHGASSVMINSREHEKRVQTDCSSYDDKRPCFCARAQTGPIPMLADWQAEGHKALWQSLQALCWESLSLCRSPEVKCAMAINSQNFIACAFSARIFTQETPLQLDFVNYRWMDSQVSPLKLPLKKQSSVEILLALSHFQNIRFSSWFPPSPWRTVERQQTVESKDRGKQCGTYVHHWLFSAGRDSVLTCVE